MSLFGLNLPRRQRSSTIALSRPDLSAREAWQIIGSSVPQDDDLLLVGMTNTTRTGLRPSPRLTILRNGRIALDTAWVFRYRSRDDKRQLRIRIAGDGELSLEKQRIKTFALDADGHRIMPRGVPEDWLNSTEASEIAEARAVLDPTRYPPVSDISFQLSEWFDSRRWCWASEHRFYPDGSNTGAKVWVVIDALSGEVLSEKVTRYVKGLPISETR